MRRMRKYVEFTKNIRKEMPETIRKVVTNDNDDYY